MPRGVGSLLDNGEAFGAEPVIRTVLELAFNVAWVYNDTDRATCYRDHGFGRAEAWLKAVRQSGVVFTEEAEQWLKSFLSQRSDEPLRFPKPFRRSEQVEVVGK